ncbi:putative nickel transport protein [Peziza echinospora]|nr:putative nickel transport protein [Peziza echinospora]
MPPPSSRLGKARLAAEDFHGRIPYLRRLPPKASGIIIVLVIVNLLVWGGVGVVLHYNSSLMGTAVLAYTLGLRHALDADHISAIDLMTRRLIASGQRPVTVGMYFSLGHSTIVVITSLVVAATAAAFSEKFDRFSRVGGIIGTSVSTAFLVVLAGVNIWILWRLWKKMGGRLERERERRRRGEGQGGREGFGDECESGGGGGDLLKMEGAGCMFTVFKGAFRLIDRPWKMYPLGVMFGLGFDTSSEIALLGISAIQAAKGANIWLIMIFPVLFTAGMCLLDTTDGALMSALYTSTSLASDPISILYYSIVLTIITVLVAVAIGTIQLLSLIYNVAEPTPGSSKFWDGVERLTEKYDVIGGCIVACFVVLGVASVLVHKRWRGWVMAREGRGVKIVVEGGRGHREQYGHGVVEQVRDVEEGFGGGSGGDRKVDVKTALSTKIYPEEVKNGHGHSHASTSRGGGGASGAIPPQGKI